MPGFGVDFDEGDDEEALTNDFLCGTLALDRNTKLRLGCTSVSTSCEVTMINWLSLKRVVRSEHKSKTKSESPVLTRFGDANAVYDVQKSYSSGCESADGELNQHRKSTSHKIDGDLAGWGSFAKQRIAD